METGNKAEINGKHIILHLGMPKTGSSAIQRFLSTNRRALEKKGIGYFVPSCRYHPWNGDQNADFLLYKVLGEIGEEDVRMRHIGSLKEECEAFKEYCRSYHKLILSDEDLWDRGAAHKAFLPALKDRISKLCGSDARTDVIVYFRRQDLWLLSRWKEDIRSIDEISDEFIESVERYRSVGYLDYNKLLDNAAKVFGDEHILIRPYDKSRMTGGSAVPDFLEAVGVDDHEGLVFSKEKVNKGFSMHSTEALRLIKRGKVPYDGPWEAILFAMWRVHTEADVTDDSFPMTYKDRQSLIQEFAESNRMMAERFFGGKELFSEDLEEYKVWEADPERDIKNAEAVVDLARMFLTRKLR